MGLEDKKSTLRLINSDEIKPIKEWEESYPDLWLLIEVTKEDIWEVYEGKLIAAAEDPMDLVEIGKEYDKRGIVTLHTRGIYTEPQPVVVTRFF
jgi:hypothetical protein